jgi:hypothetical protein
MHRSSESSKAVFRQAVGVWAAGDISALDEVVAADYIGHPAGLEGWVNALQSGTTDQEVLAGICGSPEGFAKWS